MKFNIKTRNTEEAQMDTLRRQLGYLKGDSGRDLTGFSRDGSSVDIKWWLSLISVLVVEY